MVISPFRAIGSNEKLGNSQVRRRGRIIQLQCAAERVESFCRMFTMQKSFAQLNIQKRLLKRLSVVLREELLVNGGSFQVAALLFQMLCLPRERAAGTSGKKRQHNKNNASEECGG